MLENPNSLWLKQNSGFFCTCTKQACFLPVFPNLINGPVSIYDTNLKNHP